MPNVFTDFSTAASLFRDVRRERKEGRNVRLDKVYRIPIINPGYWGFIPEWSLFCGEKWKPVRDVFHNFPEETQHALTFTPKNGEWTDRIELWEKPLRDALPLDMYMEAMAILCDWALRCMKRRADIDEEVSIDG